MRTLSCVLTLGVWLIAACAFLMGCNGEDKGGGTTGKPPSEVKTTATKAQTVCPITGQAIDRKQFVDREGKRIYFCCPGCPPEFSKEPAKYLAQMAKEGVALEKSPEPATPPEPPTPPEPGKAPGPAKAPEPPKVTEPPK